MRHEKKLCIFGASGAAKEIRAVAKNFYDTVAYIDLKAGNPINGIPVKDEDFFDSNIHCAIVGIGDSILRFKIVSKLLIKHPQIKFVTLVDSSSVLLDKDHIAIGRGSIIGANSTLTTDITLGEFTFINLNCTIGHNCKLGNFLTTAPGTKISGKVTCGERVYFGSNSVAIENIYIVGDVIIGAGSVVTKNILESGVYVGIPARKIKNIGE